MLANRCAEWQRVWLQRARQEGFLEAYICGAVEGYREGQRNGAASVLTCWLVQRFGTLSDAQTQRIATADFETLLGWFPRLFDAGSVDEVLN